MNQLLLIEKYNYINKTNKVLVFLLVLLIVLSAVLSFMLFSSLKSNKTIILPPHISEPFSTYNGKISKAGLIDQAKYMVHLFLDVTPSNAASQHERLLDYVSPNDYAKVKEMLTAIREKIKSLGVSSIYRVSKISVIEKTQTVIISGEQTLYQGEAAKSSGVKKYMLKFKNVLGKHSLVKLVEIVDE